jgi:hypothetical protein
MPAAADAMTMAFRRFDIVTMACSSIVLACEATRVLARAKYAPADHIRAALSVLAAAAAVYESTRVSPRIATLHYHGAIRGLGEAGMQLDKLHDTAELLGKAQVMLLAAVVILHAWTAMSPVAARRSER